jgi:hypothetical protein
MAPEFKLKNVTFAPVMRTVQEEVFNRFDGKTSAVWTNGGFDLADTEKMLIEPDVTCAKLC